jgi:desulfoferrodoxin-like iron-binding protein
MLGLNRIDRKCTPGGKRMTDFYKCNACEKLVKVINEGKGELSCCGSPMKMLSGFGSINEILDFAIEKEQEASQFYTDWAKKLTSPNLRDMFEHFAQEELKHKEKLIWVQKGNTFQPSAKQVTDLKIVDYLVDIMPSPNMDYQEALIIAMKREKASFKLYNDLTEVAGTENLQSLFNALAQEEAKHKLRLETEYEKEIYSEN